MDVRMPDPGAELPAVAQLLAEYATTPEVALSAAVVLADVARWPGPFAPPSGGFWVAASGPELAGCAGLRPHGPGAGELARVYVRPGFRGQGIGRRLVERALAAASAAGYARVVLDTLPGLEASVRLYTSLGFAPVEPWAGAPPGALCLSREVVGAATGRAPDQEWLSDGGHAGG
jgi:putative acetyltransferase